MEDSLDELACAICLELPSGKVEQCVNGHVFCASPCLEQYLSKAKTYNCPCCRVPIDPNQPIRSLAAEHIIAMLPGLTAQGNAASSDAGVCVGAALGCTYSTVDGAASRAEHEAKCPHAIAQRAVERERAAWRTALRKLENRVEQLEAGRPAASPAPASASQQPSLSYGNQDGHAALYASSFADAPADDDARASWQMTRVGGAVRGHAGSVCALAASCAGDWVLSGSLDRTVRLWRRRSAADGGGSGAEASSYLASEPAPLVELTHATGHAGVVCAVAAHPRRAGTAYTGSFDGTLRVWEVDVGRGTLACAACVNVGSKVLSLVPALHGDELYAGTARGDVFMFAVPGDGTSAPERRAVFEAHAGVDVRALALAERQGATAVLFTAGGDACIKAWRADPVRLAAGGVTLATLTGHGNPVRALALASHMQLLFSGSSDATIRVWFVGGLTGMGGVGAPRCLHVLRGHRDSVWSLAIDKYFLYSGSADACVRVWALRQGAAMLEAPEGTDVLEGHQDVVWTVGLVAKRDGGDAMVLSGSADCSIAAWAWGDNDAGALGDA